MTPDEKIIEERLYVLNKIKEGSLRTKDDEPIQYEFTSVIGGGGPTTENEIKTIHKLEELKAIQILFSGSSDTNGYEPYFEVKVLQPMFDNLHSEYSTSINNKRDKVGNQSQESLKRPIQNFYIKSQIHNGSGDNIGKDKNINTRGSKSWVKEIIIGLIIIGLTTSTSPWWWPMIFSNDSTAKIKYEFEGKFGDTISGGKPSSYGLRFVGTVKNQSESKNTITGIYLGVWDKEQKKLVSYCSNFPKKIIDKSRGIEIKLPILLGGSEAKYVEINFSIPLPDGSEDWHYITTRIPVKPGAVIYTEKYDYRLFFDDVEEHLFNEDGNLINREEVGC